MVDFDYKKFLQNANLIYPPLAFMFSYLLKNDFLSLVGLVSSFIVCSSYASVLDYQTRLAMKIKSPNLYNITKLAFKHTPTVIISLMVFILYVWALITLYHFIYRIDGLILFLYGVAGSFYTIFTLLLEWRNSKRLLKGFYIKGGKIGLKLFRKGNKS